VGELAARLVQKASHHGAALVVEDLRFIDDRDLAKKFNRVSHQFVYRKLLEAVERKAAREGVRLVKVHPAYTSAIGSMKYAHQYRLSIHEASAVAIGRRGMGLKERVPKPMQKLVRNVTAMKEWKAWAALKKTVVKRLEEKGVKSLVFWPEHRTSVLGLVRSLT